jgi:ribosome maturation factor RimP
LSRGPYTLEVSSPGIDRPISRDQDFEKFRGAIVKIRTRMMIEGIKNFQGILEDYTEEDGRKIVRIDVAGKIYRIPKDEIVKANLVDEEALILS